MKMLSIASRHTARQILTDQRARQIIGLAGAFALVSLAQPALADGTDRDGPFHDQVMDDDRGLRGRHHRHHGRWLCQADRPNGLGKAVTVLIGIGIIFSASTIVGWMGGTSS
jgi:type IV secretion system protein VirB2